MLSIVGGVHFEPDDLAAEDVQDQVQVEPVRVKIVVASSSRGLPIFVS